MSIANRVLLSCTALLLLNSCAGEGGGPGICGANVVDQGLQLSVKEIGQNIYEIELCSDAQNVDVYSVYGSINEQDLHPDLINLQASARLAQINGSKRGTKFQVNFKSTDRFFAIYKDKLTGLNSYAADSTEALVTPHGLPGR